MAAGMAQVVQSLPRKHKVLISNTNIAKKIPIGCTTN
jgi:hypothetical protein